MPRVPYVVQDTSKSNCPGCRGSVALLCPQTGTTRLPWFYICFACRYVGQAGVGPVKDER